MDTAEWEQRVEALAVRLEIEDFFFRCLDVAAPYLNEEDKVGWKPADVLAFLTSEIDPNFLKGRHISVSRDTPDADTPKHEDYKNLDFSPLGLEPDVKIRELKKYWGSMGQLLHRDVREKIFDVEKAKIQIAKAGKFCNALSGDVLFLQSDIKVVERTCANGHITKRNALRMKAGQIIPCMSPGCTSVYQVHGENPTSWGEYKLLVKCDVCENENYYPLKPLVDLSYWENATVLCLNESCQNKIVVQWVLSRKIEKPKSIEK